MFSWTQEFAFSRNLSARSSSTNSVLPVINTGSKLSPNSHSTNDLNIPMAPPTSSEWISSTNAVEEVFSKSETITQRILSSNVSTSTLSISDIASVFASAYASILPTGEAQGLEPDSVIWYPSSLNLLVTFSARSWSNLLLDLLNPNRTYLSKTGLRIKIGQISDF